MTTERKTITREQYMVAFGLFTVAHERKIEADRYETELKRRLGFDPEGWEGNYVTDAIWGDRPFDEAMRLDGFVIEPEPSPTDSPSGEGERT